MEQLLKLKNKNLTSNTITNGILNFIKALIPVQYGASIKSIASDLTTLLI